MGGTSVSQLHKAVDYPLGPGGLELDFELVAFLRRDSAVTELLVRESIA